MDRSASPPDCPETLRLLPHQPDPCPDSHTRHAQFPASGIGQADAPLKLLSNQFFITNH
jgi:hypothetical protein